MIERALRLLYAFEAAVIGVPTLLLALLLAPVALMVLPLALGGAVAGAVDGNRFVERATLALYLVGGYLGLPAWCVLTYRYLARGARALVDVRALCWGLLGLGMAGALAFGVGAMARGKADFWVLLYSGPGMLLPMSHLALVRCFQVKRRQSCPAANTY